MEKTSKNINYQEYLKTEHWAKLRERVFREAGRQCNLCKRRKPLEAHHKTYERLGKENIDDMVALCRRCHEVTHDIEPSLNTSDARLIGEIVIEVLEKYLPTPEAQNEAISK